MPVFRQFGLWVTLGWLATSLIALGAEVDPADPIAGRLHWAFRPLDSEPPTKMSQWARSPIDQYIADGWTELQLKPVPDAPRRTLARRLYSQIIGLPPSPVEYQRFVDDPAPGVIERTLDRLLASPEFGVRWGRHWLDLARYADSNGLDENFLFREAWRYRNWVIEAVNQDLPYDDFLVRQIAGDLLPHETIAQRDQNRIASGFLVVGPKVLLGIPRERQRMEVADEQLDTIGRTVLGMTIGCARCHDHKFDPIPTRDYYALAGIFTSTEVMEQRYMLGQQRVMERLVGLGEDGQTLNQQYETFWRGLPKLRTKKNQADAILKALKDKDRDMANDLAKKTPSSAIDDFLNSDVKLDDLIDRQEQFVKEVEKAIKAAPSIPPRAMIPVDRKEAADEAIRRAGQFNRKGEVVPRGFLQVLNSNAPLKLDAGESGRDALAYWLTDVETGAGVLAARVLANRVWYHLMGRGLVRTLDNFGRTGETPSHPKLLDYLAGRLIESGWSVKALVREIVTSRVWGLTSESNDIGLSRDPENTFYWRGTRRRCEPEVVRDSMMSIAGTLSLDDWDSSVSYLGDQATAVGANKNRRRTDFPVRSVYLPMIRNDLPELFDSFDFADPHATTGARPKTMAPSQALYMLNGEEVLRLASATMTLIWSENDTVSHRIEKLFRTVFNRSPSTDETARVSAFIESEQRIAVENGDDRAERLPWDLACQALFSSSEFQYVD